MTEWAELGEAGLGGVGQQNTHQIVQGCIEGPHLTAHCIVKTHL